MTDFIDRRAIGRIVNDWNAFYPATRLRIDAVTRDERIVYSAQLGFSDGSDAEFDLTEDALCAPVRFPNMLARRGPSRYSRGQWMLFDELAVGAFKIVTERMGGVWDVASATRAELKALGGYSPKVEGRRAKR